MKKLLFILFLLFNSVVAFCQTTRSSTPGFTPRANQTFVVEDGIHSARNGLFTPRFADTTEANIYTFKDTCGNVIYTYSTNTLWVRSCASSTKQWVQVGSGGGGSGTVTSFSSGNLSPLFTTSVANATTTPALSFTLSNAGANTWFGNNTGSSAAPSYNTFGVGVNTWITTPSSANLATAVTDETGSGALVFANSPTFTTPNIGTATGSITGNAGTATILQTARNINGVSFNGSADITVTAAAGTLTGTTLASNVVSSSLTSVGTIATGVWNGTVIGTSYGGTGLTSIGTSLQQIRVNAGGTALEYFTPSSSGTVNSGTQYRIAYYATTGTAVSEANAITANRALISDANGVPTHSTTTSTELGYVNGVTSAIQTQIDGKANTELSNLASVAINTSLISDANNTDDLGTTSVAWKDIYSYSNRLKGSTSGEITLAATAIAGTNTITFPAITGTTMLLEGTQTTTGNKTFTGNVFAAGGLFTSTTSLNSNFGVPQGIGASASVANAEYQLEGSAATQYRIVSRGSTSSQLAVGSSYAAILLGQTAITEPVSGNSNLLAGLALKTQTITAGAGTVSNTATLYIEGASSATVSDQNSAAWIASGNLRLGKAGTAIGTMSFEGNTSGKVILTPAAAAGTPTLTFGTTTGILAGTLTNTATLDFASTGAGAVADLTITVTGAADGDAVSLGVPNSSVTATATYTAWVSAANTVTVRFSPKATEDPASGIFRVSVTKY